jgi:UDP-N-acetylmuramoylalanine--D-glutamate ligase
VKKLAILGGRESGVGAALLAKKEGWEVWVSDFGAIPDKFRVELEQAGIPFEENGHDESQILDADYVVKSPGIPHKVPIVKKIKEKGIPLISEIEFASWYTRGKIIAITGANGKTTTTSLIYWVLSREGLDVACAGNIGDSFAKMLAQGDHAYWVLEISSFQLDDIERFKPWVAILTNITPDHLDRYGYEIGNYAAAKYKIAENQGPDDYFIYCADDPLTMEYMKGSRVNAQKLGFSLNKQDGMTAWMEDKTIHVQMFNDDFDLNYDRMTVRGQHNAYNTMAAAIVSRVLDLRKDSIRESFADFQNIEHRLEKVAVVRGVEFINDSKATNVNSTWYALESVNKQMVWIAGGVDKGNDYSLLVPLVEKKVKTIIALGTDNRKIHEAFGPKVNLIINTTSMEEAVNLAYHLADKDEAVLLSPACASFDLFENYEDRGRQFKECVREL